MKTAPLIASIATLKLSHLIAFLLGASCMFVVVQATSSINSQQPANPTPEAAVTAAQEDCWSYHASDATDDIDMYKSIAAAETKIGDTPVAIDLLKDRCRMLVDHWRFDVTGDSALELIISASPFCAGSCHGRAVYVFDGNQLIFDSESNNDGGWDTEVSPIAEGQDGWPGFVITTSILLKGESFNGASHGIATSYTYNPMTNSFDEGFLQKIVKLEK